MKKLLAVALVMGFTMTLAACNKTTTPTTDDAMMNDAAKVIKDGAMMEGEALPK